MIRWRQEHGGYIDDNLCTLFAIAAEAHGFPAGGLLATCECETNFAIGKVSSAGAVGPMQFLPKYKAEYTRYAGQAFDLYSWDAVLGASAVFATYARWGAERHGLQGADCYRYAVSCHRYGQNSKTSLDMNNKRVTDIERKMRLNGMWWDKEDTQVTKVQIGHARYDEHGKTTGGKAGDQTGREVMTSDWYKHSKGWVLLRCKDPAAAKQIANAARRAAENDLIGYDQHQRNTLYNAIKDHGFDPARVTKAVETDCSALVRVCCAYAGIDLPDFNTSSEAATLTKSGKFDKLTDSKYTTSQDYLRTGDILVTKTKGHTVVVLTDGDRAHEDAGQPDTAPQLAVCTGDKVNIRSGPGTQYASVGKVSKGHPLVVGADKNADKNEWLRVATLTENAAITGYISAKYVEIKK